MMMLKMMNPFGSVTDSIPGVGGKDDDDEGLSKEEAEEQERARQEAIKQAERERRDKYKKQEEEREGMRQTIRDKVISCTLHGDTHTSTDMSLLSTFEFLSSKLRSKRIRRY